MPGTKKKLFKFFSLMLGTAIALSGCFPSGAQKTRRPQIDASPWTEKKVQNKSSGNWYRYMYKAGPTEDAPVAILLHGGIFDNRIWLNFHRLSKKYTVYAPQYPDSSPLYNRKIEDWGKVVTDFVKAVNVSPSLIVGVSNGAYGAIEYLLQNDVQSAKGLVLISTAMLSSSKKEIKKRTRMARFALRLSPGKLQGLVESRAEGTEYASSPGKVTQKDIFYVRPYPYYYQLFSVPYTQGDKKQKTHNIKLPVLILHGTEDEIMPLWTAEDTLSAFDNATLKTFSGEGHDMTFSIGPTLCDVILEHYN
ncbi:MAG: alpha/beta hydrolase [Deltaproteobacteria bacterium]|nr:alpha/beta hydrolase [Deltaproteobacteria bacterium]